MKQSSETLAPGLLAVLPCTAGAVLMAHAAAGDPIAAGLTAGLLVIAGLAIVREQGRGSRNIMALAYLFGLPLGIIAGMIRL